MPYLDPNKQREYQRIWIADRRAAYLFDKCCPCGSKVDLEIHHRNPAEKISHRIWNWTEERRAVELAKCDVLCKDCHAKITSASMRKPIEHGTGTAYTSGCRCIPCREGNRNYRRNRRALGFS